MAAPPKPPGLRLNLLGSVRQGRAQGRLDTPDGAVQRRPAGVLPALPDGIAPPAGTRASDLLRAEELARVGRLTSFTALLSQLAEPGSYRTQALGMARLTRAIRGQSSDTGTDLPRRFGCASAEELANRLLFIHRQRGLQTQADALAAERRTGSVRRPQGRIWAAGGGLWEALVHMDEALSDILRRLAQDEFGSLRSARAAIALRPGPRGRFSERPVPFSRAAEIGAPLRSTQVATRREGSEKLYDSIDDIHVSVVSDQGRRWLVLLVRAQIKREAAAKKLGDQTDRDLVRWTEDGLAEVVLKDLLDERGEPLRFARDQILFVRQAVSRPVGIVQQAGHATLGDGPRIRQDRFETPRGVPVLRLTVAVDVSLHDRLIEAVLGAAALPR